MVLFSCVYCIDILIDSFLVAICNRRDQLARVGLQICSRKQTATQYSIINEIYIFLLKQELRSAERQALNGAYELEGINRREQRKYHVSKLKESKICYRIC